MANTIPINDRIGDGGPTSIAVYSHDANGNTVLVGADGEIIPTLGANVVTVGAGGMFTTLQAAIDYVETLPQFELVTGVGTSPTVTAWTQWSDSLTVTGLAGQAQLGREGYWFTHTSLAGMLYPIDAALGMLSTTLVSSFRRREASFSGSEALTFYKPIMRVIQVLQNTDLDEAVTIAGPVCLTIKGDGRQVWDGLVTNNGLYGILHIQGFSSATMSKTQGACKQNTALELIDCHWKGINDGWMSPGFTCGSLTIRGGTAKQYPSIALGHFIVNSGAGACSGDMLIDGMRIEVYPQNALATCDFRVVDIDVASAYRRILIDNVTLAVYDKDGNMNKCTFLGANFSPCTITDSRIEYYSPVASDTVLSLANDNIDGLNPSTGVCIISGCDISASPLHTGSKYAFRANHASSSNTVVVNNCGALIAQKPAAGTLTVLSQALGLGTTGAGSAALGANCPATTPPAPNTWKKVTLDDGTTGYVPVWK